MDAQLMKAVDDEERDDDEKSGEEIRDDEKSLEEIIEAYARS